MSKDSFMTMDFNGAKQVVQGQQPQKIAYNYSCTNLVPAATTGRQTLDHHRASAEMGSHIASVTRPTAKSHENVFVN